ncbi:MAG: hypothetical protein A2057_05410 [Ignavibacteria bacterium GWA2_35_9]|nr:MAG: hypothetical protein A2057_05410 [Ignavibacteria bacterium GWA2_35_9]OGU47224.1 MAG: hypothetical protein A2000_00805 [Ignavibacteria bacterium GWB2_36_8]OGU50103.1 MAG: hypothetical protein A2080_11780 [Ignavibacteria bacterium GWC2_36_12]
MSDELPLLFLGGLIGAGLAAPKPSETVAIKDYNRIFEFIDKRKRGLGDFTIEPFLLYDKKVFNVLNEAFQMYLNGSNKGSSFLCIAILESKLREKYGMKNFEEMILKAKEDKLISSSQFHFLNGLRIDRNFIVHNIFEEFSEEDAQITFRLVIRFLNNLYKWNE